MGSNGQDIKIFQPSGKDMRIEYPELNDIPEFEKLKGTELKFVWYYSNRTSPYYTIRNPKMKVLKCMELAFGGNISSDMNSRYQAGNFPEYIRIAMDRMQRFSPSTRLRAKITIEKIFENLEKITELNHEDLVDLQSRKEYANLAVTVTKNMGDIVKQMENAFGVKYHNQEEEKEKGPTIMDRLHMEDNN